MLKSLDGKRYSTVVGRQTRASSFLCSRWMFGKRFSFLDMRSVALCAGWVGLSVGQPTCLCVGVKSRMSRSASSRGMSALVLLCDDEWCCSYSRTFIS